MDTPRPIRVELVPHDPAWASLARAEADSLHAALGDGLLAVHHIGSTAIAGIRAKPIIDLMPVVRSPALLDESRLALEGSGFRWWGELGLPGRRYCTRDDPASGKRLVQLHLYAQGSRDIARHLAFRDHLCREPECAREYEREKLRCQRLHPDDSHAYGDCKSDWIRGIEAQVIATHPLSME